MSHITIFESPPRERSGGGGGGGAARQSVAETPSTVAATPANPRQRRRSSSSTVYSPRFSAMSVRGELSGQTTTAPMSSARRRVDDFQPFDRRMSAANSNVANDNVANTTPNAAAAAAAATRASTTPTLADALADALRRESMGPSRPSLGREPAPPKASTSTPTPQQQQPQQQESARAERVRRRNVHKAQITDVTNRERAPRAAAEKQKQRRTSFSGERSVLQPTSALRRLPR